MIYLVAQTKKPTTKEELNAILRAAAEGEMHKYVAYTEQELVSSDFKKNPYSSIIDSKLNNANGDLVQIAAWYDNEWGYSCRLAELTAMVLTTIPANA
jgi:glyceraldehyde-3-phosphate dehydrogenase/erythrose-4-phosphate dehydrogenase